MEQMKRLLALSLICALLFSMFPTEAFAATTEAELPVSVEQIISEIVVETDPSDEVGESAATEAGVSLNPASDVLPVASELEYTYATDTTAETAIITGYTGSDPSITLPSTLGGCPVTEIAAFAFENNTTLVTVVFPEYLTTIGNYAFAGCTGLTSLELPDGVTTIGAYAFQNCTELASVNYPLSLSACGGYIFDGCSDLTSIAVPEGVTAIADNAFEGCTYLETVTLPSTVTSIGVDAFFGCTGLGGIILPDGLTSIGHYAFAGCTGLTSLELPDSVATIGTCAFQNCTNLISVNYPLSLSACGGYIFEGCSGLTSITIPEGVTVIPDNAFEGCTYLETIVLPSTVTSIGVDAFFECTGLDGIDLPAGLISIDHYAFSGCAGLDEIILPDRLTFIGNYAFAGCTGLAGLDLPDSVATIGGYAFQNCTNLISVNYPLSLSACGGYIFEGCSGLTSITVPEGVTAIADNAFEGCTYLETIVLPSTVTSIGVDAFFGCTGLGGIILPDGLTSIGNYAFAGCTGFTGLDLPDSVTTIGAYAFQNCINLVSANYPLGLSDCGGYIFEGCSGLTSITVPEGVTAIPGNAFEGCDYLKSVALPSTLTELGYSSFYGCKQLETADIPQNVMLIDHYAFADCDTLRYVIVNNADCVIETNAFYNSPQVTLVCYVNSLATVFAINHDIPYSANGSAESSQSGILDRTATSYLANTNGLTANGYLTFTIDYSVSDTAWTELFSRDIVIKVPAGTELIESTLRLGDTICTDYEYDEEMHKLTIPVAESSCTIKYSAKAVEDRNIRSYALLNYDGTQEVIGIIDENVDIFTVYAEQLTSSRTIQVQGAAPAETAVDIYVDGALQTSVTSSKGGAFLASVPLEGTASAQVFKIKASCLGNAGKAMTATCSVKYRQEAPELTGFAYYMGDDDSQMIDIYTLAQSGIQPAITVTNTENPYKFVITYENPESIDTLYVTSTRSNTKKSIPAVYDKTTGTFIAEGYFDEQNKSYVPGTLGLEYNLTHDEVLVGQEVDWDKWRGYLSNDLINGAVVKSTATEVGSFGTIDLSGVSESFMGVVLDYNIGQFDEKIDGNLSDLMSMAGEVENIYGYIVPGVDDSRYYALLDFRDPETISMIVSDMSGIANKAVKLKLSTSIIGENIGNMSYTDFSDLAIGLSNFATGAEIVYEAFGIQSDYNDLCDEIMQSSTIIKKSEALKKAKELRNDQTAFMLMTSLLPLVVAGGPMTGPALLLTAMIGSTKALSDVFWNYRIAQIKGGSFKIKWFIDPSGYVYDAVTNDRLQGVTATAYCIEYDDTDIFWDHTPSETEYGTLWDALAYNQANPLVTDAEGRYAWDVPEGWWRVKYEKDGYETAWSDWLPVPPPQTEVNIGMTPNAGLLGDVNDDGTINVLDLMYLANYFAKGETINQANADVNADGLLDVRDLMFLANVFAGKETLE